MTKVTVVLFDYVLATAVYAMSEMFHFAGRLVSEDAEDVTQFDLRLASLDGKPVKNTNGLFLTPHCALTDIEWSDIWLVPAIVGDIDRTLYENKGLVDYLGRAGQSNAMLGSNSTGAFLLAEAGLLNGKSATTHRQMQAKFAARYPEVNLQLNQELTHDGQILTDSGGMPWFDMGLYLIELFSGRDIASAIAEYFIVDRKRSAKLSFAPSTARRQHNDQTILAIQSWLEAELSSDISLEKLEHRFGISNRSLIRRFRKCTGDTPAHYLQNLRLERASRLLLHSGRNVESIANAVGYQDISSFSRLFKRRVGMSPGNYRARYR